MTSTLSSADSSHTTTNQTVTLNYIQWREEFNTEKPYEVISEIPDGCKRQNFSLGPGPAQTIHDIRGREDKFNLEDNGFEVRQHAITTNSFDKDSVESYYLPAVKLLLESVDPGAEVHIFDWRLRSSDKTHSNLEPGTRIDLNDPALVLEPVHAVHNDQSRLAAIKRARYHAGNKSEELLKRRFRIINVWRPLRYSIENFPLALCDGSTVPAESLLAVDHVRKGYVGESFYPLYDERLKWYFLNNQTKDEVLLFKTFDSSSQTKAKCCPHTSFQQSNVRLDHNPRETIEVRAMVFSKV